MRLPKLAVRPVDADRHGAAGACGEAHFVWTDVDTDRLGQWCHDLLLKYRESGVWLVNPTRGPWLPRARMARASSAPGRTQASPGRPEASPERTEASPGRPEASPERTEASPGRPEASPGRTEASPGRTQASP